MRSAALPAELALLVAHRRSAREQAGVTISGSPRFARDDGRGLVLCDGNAV
jgi:hypothetical protein